MCLYSMQTLLFWLSQVRWLIPFETSVIVTLGEAICYPWHMWKFEENPGVQWAFIFCFFWYSVSLLLIVEFTRPTLSIFSNNDCIYRICSNLLSIFQLKQVLTMEMFSLSYHLKKPPVLPLCIRIKRIHLFTFLMWMQPWCLLMLVSSYSTCLAQVKLHCVSCF